MVPPSRRSFLRTSLSLPLLVAGCLASDEQSATATTHTTRLGDSGTATPESKPEIDCDAVQRPAPQAGENDEVEPRAYPDPPDGDVDASWVTKHERAYVLNHALARHDLVEMHGLAVEETETEPRADGLVVRLSYTYGYRTDAAVADSPLITAAYYVDDQGALRAETDGTYGELATDLDPVQEGTPIVCF